MKEVKTPKKPLAIYYAIVLLVLLILNFVIMPWASERQIKEVDYGTFMSMTEEKNIGRVDIESNQILFTDKENTQVYKTGLMNDPGLTERLYDAGAQFSSEIVEQASPLLSFLASFVLPIVIFVALGNYMNKKLMDKAGGVLDQVQALLDSMNQVMGNPDFQKNFLQMAVNIRDMTAHMDGLVAAMEQTMRENQGNITGMLSNLNAASAGLNRTMNQVEAMMTNLATVGADPQTAENLRLTLANIKDTSDRIAHIAENMDGAVGDPQTAEDIKTTIRNARQMSEKAGNMMGKLEDIKVKPSADLLYSGAKDDWKANFNVDLGPETGNFLRAGLDDIGDGNRGNLEVGRRTEHYAVRGGVINGDVGLGLDAYAGKRFVFSVDAMDPNDPALRLGAQYQLNDAGTWLMGQWDDVNDSDKRTAYVGLRQSF